MLACKLQILVSVSFPINTFQAPIGDLEKDSNLSRKKNSKGWRILDVGNVTSIDWKLGIIIDVYSQQ
jgi:hypothetical protein